jgi:chromosomal replication initiator protein
LISSTFQANTSPGQWLRFLQPSLQDSVGQLQIQLNRSTYDTWLRHAELLAYEEGRFVVSVPHAYAKDWIERHLLHSMTRTISDIFRRESEVQIIVWNPVEDDDNGQDSGPLLDYVEESESEASGEALKALNPDFTFENYVVGQANHYPSLLAKAVVESTIGTYSPVLLCGGMGMGKTHLLQAIARGLIEQGYTVIYTSAEDFTTELVAAIRNQENTKFRERYRTADAVLIDDLQFVEGKTSTQNEIVAIWDALRNRRKAMIFASDRLPCDMSKVSKDARSRFQAGPIAMLEPPDLPLRMAILESKSARRGLILPPDVRGLIAGRVEASARDLESAVEQLHTYAQLTRQPITGQMARMVLKSLGSSAAQDIVSLNAVVEAATSYFRLSPDDLAGRKRTQIIARARQLVMYLAREETTASLPQIGEALGGRDHSTVVHGCARIAALITTDATVAGDVESIRQILHSAQQPALHETEPVVEVTRRSFSRRN